MKINTSPAGKSGECLPGPASVCLPGSILFLWTADYKSYSLLLVCDWPRFCKDPWELFVTQNYILIYLLFTRPYFPYLGIMEVKAIVAQFRTHRNFFLSHKELKKRKLKPTEETEYNIAISRLFLMGQGGSEAAQSHNWWLCPSPLYLPAPAWLWKCHRKGVINFYSWRVCRESQLIPFYKAFGDTQVMNATATGENTSRSRNLAQEPTRCFNTNGVWSPTTPACEDADRMFALLRCIFVSGFSDQGVQPVIWSVMEILLWFLYMFH